MILHIGGLKNFTIKHQGAINNHNNVAGYRVNLYKSIALLYINNKRTGKEIIDKLIDNSIKKYQGTNSNQVGIWSPQ